MRGEREGKHTAVDATTAPTFTVQTVRASVLVVTTHLLWQHLQLVLSQLQDLQFGQPAAKKERESIEKHQHS